MLLRTLYYRRCLMDWEGKSGVVTALCRSVGARLEVVADGEPVPVGEDGREAVVGAVEGGTLAVGLKGMAAGECI